MESIKNIFSKKSSKIFGNTPQISSLANSNINNTISSGIETTKNSISNFNNSLKQTLKPTPTVIGSIGSTIKTPISALSEKTQSVFNNIKTPISEFSKPTTISTGSWFSGNFFLIFSLIFILALLGLNVFTYLTEGINAFNYFFTKSVNEFPEKTKNVAQNTLSGVNFGTDVLSGMVKNTTNIISDQLNMDHINNKIVRKKPVKKIKKEVVVQDFKEEKSKRENKDYKENSEDNKIQENKKSGYCYVGTDRGYRSCIKIGNTDECLSKNIFPTKELCINPNLRV